MRIAICQRRSAVDERPRIHIERPYPDQMLFKTTNPCKIISYPPHKPVNKFKRETEFVDLVLKIDGVNWAQLDDDYTLFINLKSGLNEDDLVRIPVKIVKIIKEFSGIDFAVTL